MPLKARLVVAACAALYVLLSAALLGVSVLLIPVAWVSWLLAAVLIGLAVVLLDAFHPKVSLFLPSLSRIDQAPGEKTIALTFDDGPVYPWTQDILDVFERYQLKASFFCIGDNVRRNPDLAREIVRRGHTLGNHSDTHRNLLLASAARVEQELEGAQRSIRSACGFEPRFFRCPKGYKSPLVARVLRRSKLTLVAYSYPVWDLQNPAVDVLVERVLKRAAPGDIVVMHDGHLANRPSGRDNLVAALPRIIEGLLARNIKPVSLDQAIRQTPGAVRSGNAVLRQRPR